MQIETGNSYKVKTKTMKVQKEDLDVQVESPSRFCGVDTT